MLKNVIAWVKAHQNVRMDERAAMECAHSVGVNSSDETMFRACWAMATMPNQVGAATEAVVESSEKKAAIVICASHVSHVTQYVKHMATVYSDRRAAVAVRHDFGRMFSRRFF